VVLFSCSGHSVFLDKTGQPYHRIDKFQSTDNSQKFFIIWLLALLRSRLHLADSLQKSSISRKIHVAQWRSTTRRPTIGLTDPTNGRRAPSRCRPPCLPPYAADVHLDMVADLEYALLVQYLSPLNSAGSSVSLLPGPGPSPCSLALRRCLASPPAASHAASAARRGRPARALLLHPHPPRHHFQFPSHLPRP
jgi:hypothetical protein